MDLILINIENRIKELKLELKNLEKIKKSKDVKLYLDYKGKYDEETKTES